MLLDRFPDIGRVYLMVRASSEAESESRFWETIVPSPALDPLRKRHGEALDDFLREKVVVVGGDITIANLGLSEEKAQAIAVGHRPVAQLLRSRHLQPAPRGCPQDERHRHPPHARLREADAAPRARPREHVFRRRQSIGRGLGERARHRLLSQEGRRERRSSASTKRSTIASGSPLRVRDESQDKSLADRFREARAQALPRRGARPRRRQRRSASPSLASGRTGSDRGSPTSVSPKPRTGAGPTSTLIRRASANRWSRRRTGVARAIIRPSIVESALEFPFPGWNEGFTTTAPLVRMAMRGQNLFPVKIERHSRRHPRRHGRAAALAVAAQTMVEEPELVYQVASGDTNPSRLGRLVDLLGLLQAPALSRARRRGAGFSTTWRRAWRRRRSSRRDSRSTRCRLLHKATKRVIKALDRVTSRQVGPLAPLARAGERGDRGFEAFTSEGEEHYQTFRPFIVDNNYVFRADNTRALFERAERGR